jgi:cytochrome c peroxidase
MPCADMISPMNEPAREKLPAPTFLRLSAGFIYFYFGFQKFFTDLSPGELLASQSMMRLSLHWVDASTALWWLAVIECAIGLSFLFNFMMHWMFFIFLAHQASTFIPLFILPELTFKIAPLAPTLEGQYILKNIVSVAAGWTVMLPSVKAAWQRPRTVSGHIPSVRSEPIWLRTRSLISSHLFAFVLVAVLTVGISTTYGKYRGTELSRVPVLGSAVRSRAVMGSPTRPAANQLARTTDTAATAHSREALNSRPQTSSYWGADDLLIFPTVTKGMRTPFDLWRYYGRGVSSYESPVMDMRFEQWLSFHRKQKPKLMKDVREYMASRYDFSGRPIPGQFMSGGKPIMQGPVARMPAGISSFEELAALSPAEIRSRDFFPYKPLAHPLQSTAHMVFPQEWIAVHPEHERMDVDMDFPGDYLPEFPPPLFLTTHKELGDVTNGQEITLDNYFTIFDGLLTPEQMEGLKELLRPSPTTWFNHTDHRLTEKPSKGVACLDCHVNGHTNGAFELSPDSRPILARLRVDTPTMRGNYNLMQLSSKRSIRSLDHFSEVEEYFDGDPGMQQAIGPRAVKREVSNRMGDFNAIIDYPPAPKLDSLMRLIPEMCNESELRGEALFHGKAQCAKCHYGPALVDDYLHDLQVERFYVGRPQGPIKTFALRGIKDSPPYLHDGRCPTLHDAVEFFNLVLELELTRQEKEDLVAFLLCL